MIHRIMMALWPLTMGIVSPGNTGGLFSVCRIRHESETTSVCHCMKLEAYVDTVGSYGELWVLYYLWGAVILSCA